MFKNNSKIEKEINITDLYPQLPPKEQAKAEFNLLGYLDVVTRILERVARDITILFTKLENLANLKGRRRKKKFI